MKNRLLWTISALTVLAGFTACKKDNNSGVASNSTTATVSGATFQSIAGTGVDVASQNDLTLVFVQAKSGDTTTMSLNFPDTIQVGKPYKIGGDNTVVYLEYATKDDWYSTWNGQESGTLTVTSLNKSSKNIQGTYSAIAWKAGGDSDIVKDGKFNVNFLVQ